MVAENQVILFTHTYGNGLGVKRVWCMFICVYDNE